MQMADKGEKLSLEPLTEEAVQRVLNLLDVYAPDVFDLEMAANIVSTSLQAVQQFPARSPSTSTGESDWVLAGVSDLVQNLASELADVAAGQGWLFARDLEYFELAETAKAFVLRHYEPAVQAQGVADGNLISELVGALTLLLAARKDVELMTAAIVAEAAIAKTEGRS